MLLRDSSSSQLPKTTASGASSRQQNVAAKNHDEVIIKVFWKFVKMTGLKQQFKMSEMDYQERLRKVYELSENLDGQILNEIKKLSMKQNQTIRRGVCD